MLYTAHYNSPIGKLLLAEKDNSLVGVWMEGQKYFLGTLRDEMREDNDSSVLLQAKKWLDRYFAGGKPSIGELSLAPAGSEFRKEVWKILCEIPYGEVTTYGEISKKLASRRGLNRMSAQTVGGAVGHNPLSIIVPCHRVVGANGSLTGYAGGLQKKIKLLTHEGVDIEQFFVPAKGTAL
ncbi:MAG TPA: cysteine methyltransferase [Lachnospiraceae bacterium]|nr:cysteine methyltransferase [Lachnospiraceae bacterium]